MTKTEIQLKKLKSLYYLQKVTNSVIKWTSIMSFQSLEKSIDRTRY